MCDRVTLSLDISIVKSASQTEIQTTSDKALYVQKIIINHYTIAYEGRSRSNRTSAITIAHVYMI